MTFRKRFFCFCILLFILVGFAESFYGITYSFSLPDADVKKGRLFDIELICIAEASVSAFIAEVTFDPTAIEYRKTKTLHEESQHSVNSTEEGKLTVVYLCENGVDCAESEALLTLSFKAVSQGSFTVNLCVREAIDTNGFDLGAEVCVGCSVLVKAVSSNSEISTTQICEESLADDILQAETMVGAADTTVEGKDSDASPTVTAIIAVLSALAIVSLVAYRIGVKVYRYRKSKSSDSDNKK